MTARVMWTHVQAWWGHGTPRVAGLLVVLVVGLTAPASGPHVSRVAAVLSGPRVTVLAGQLQIGPPWTWLLLSLLFVVASLPLVQLDPAPISLTLVRGVSRRQWAVARLLTVVVAAVAFLALVVLVAAVTLVIRPHPGLLVTASAAKDLGLWALSLTGLGWWQIGAGMVAPSAWPGFVTVVLLLGFSGFGSVFSPWLPTAQTILALHGLPGTLSVVAGAWYLGGWTALGGTAAWGLARTLVGYH